MIHNFGELSYLKTFKSGKQKLITTPEDEGLVLLKRIEDEEIVVPYLDVQRTFHHKKQTLSKMTDYMKQRALMLKERIHQNQNKIREMAVYAKSSNLVIRKREAAANELMLSIYNPTYHRRNVDEEEYLIPVKDFEQEVEARSGKRRLYFDVALNMKTVQRVKICTSDLIMYGLGHEEQKITQELINLGELKLFEKLKQVYGVDKDSISLLDIENLANFKLVVSTTLETNVNKSNPCYHLIVIPSNVALYILPPRRKSLAIRSGSRHERRLHQGHPGLHQGVLQRPHLPPLPAGVPGRFPRVAAHSAAEHPPDSRAGRSEHRVLQRGAVDCG